MSGEGDDLDYNPAPQGGTYEPGGQPAYAPTMLGASGGKHQASKNQARIARAEWEDYKKRFVPIENELIGQIGDRSVYGENVGRAMESVSGAYTTGAGEYGRNLNRYGVTPSDAQAGQAERQMGLSRATAMTEAANRTRSAVKDREMKIMGGGLAPTTARGQQG